MLSQTFCICNLWQYCIMTHANTRTHPFNGPFSRTTRVGRYQKGKTNLGHMQVCTMLQTDNHANTSPLSFLQAGCPSCHPTNSVKALKANDACQNSTKYNANMTGIFTSLCTHCGSLAELQMDICEICTSHSQCTETTATACITRPALYSQTVIHRFTSN